jgi:hydroxymethylbilane synthase
MTQAGTVARALSDTGGFEVELVGITTEGDRNSSPLAQIGGTGIFVSALREQLLDGVIDLAVHSLKDLPTAPPEGLTLAAVPQREDPWDVLVSRDGFRLADLPAGSRIGTGSPRRAAQLRLLDASWEILPIRGNIDTRLRRLAEGDYDAIVLARAGLARLDRLEIVTEVLDPDVMLPAPGQGALAVESSNAAPRAEIDPGRLEAVVRAIDHAPTRAAVIAERTLLSVLEAGCLAPVGAHGHVADDTLHLVATVVAEDGSEALRRAGEGPIKDAAAIGRRVAEDLLAAGAAGLMGDRRGARL